MLLEKLIRILKNDPGYKWESKYTFRDLEIIFRNRSWQVLRGIKYKLLFKNSRGMIFIGSGVNIKHCHQIYSGSNLIIEDQVYINALSEDGVRFGNNVSIARSSILICTGVIAHKGKGISIGDGTGINAGAYFGGQGGITIGNNVIIGPGVKVFSENHNFSDPEILIKNQGVTRNEVIIGDNCWIGANVTILAGVTIGPNSVIAAGAVVNKSMPGNVVIGGLPARIIKQIIKE